ncbi:MAG: class I SAM-dependent RNA methyltransferase [Candidatus Dojkabacteria bacterium]
MKKAPVELTIEGMHINGAGLSEYNNREVYVWGALSGEVVLAKIMKKKRVRYEAVVIEVLKPSKRRQTPTEAHYLSSSPWDMMTFKSEKMLKQKLASDFLSKNGFDTGKLKLHSPGSSYAYRNKMEFSFFEDDGRFSLAFYKRAGRGKIPITGSRLASDVINSAASSIVDFLNTKSLQGRPLKSLILRSNDSEEVVAGLFVTEEINMNGFELKKPLNGLRVYYSNPKSPASVIDSLLFSVGDDFLDEQINGFDLRFGLNSFFQVNTHMFKKALRSIDKHMDYSKPYLDYYSGIGSISISLGKKLKGAILVDSNSEAINYARLNIMRAGLSSFQAKGNAAESLTDLISSKYNLIVDPPRSGLHKKVITKILGVLPEQIIYMSCNIETQARDIALLQAGYEVTSSELFNFFPRTPHIESLFVLKKRS